MKPLANALLGVVLALFALGGLGMAAATTVEVQRTDFKAAAQACSMVRQHCAGITADEDYAPTAGGRSACMDSLADLREDVRAKFEPGEPLAIKTKCAKDDLWRAEMRVPARIRNKDLTRCVERERRPFASCWARYRHGQPVRGSSG